MATLNDIRSINWQIGIAGSGSIVEGMEDVRQCLDVILRTQKGTDALRPEFGSDIYQWIDKPVNAVIPNVKRAIISAVEIFEKRVEVVSVKHNIDSKNIQFFITYKLVDADIIEQLQLYMSGTGFITTPVIPGNLIIEADIPTNGSFQLMLNFITNGNPALPEPPVFGFANATIMYAWIMANWGSYGTWYLLPGKLIGYLNNTISTAGLEITMSAMYRYSSPVPHLIPGKVYGLNFQPDSMVAGSVLSAGFTLNELLNYVITNLGSNGNWVIESYDGTGDFDYLDFNNDDFNVRLFYQLVLYSTTLPNAALEITAV